MSLPLSMRDQRESVVYSDIPRTMIATRCGLQFGGGDESYCCIDTHGQPAANRRLAQELALLVSDLLRHADAQDKRLDAWAAELEAVAAARELVPA